MTYEEAYEINDKNKIIIRLPERFKSKKRVRVTIEEVKEDRDEKIKLMKGVSKDPLFLSDICEIQDDFKYADSEEL